jgi:MYXO-CTERM domain-containing protein
VPPPPSEDDGGCTFGVGSRSTGTALGLLVLAGLARARRRRNAARGR